MQSNNDKILLDQAASLLSDLKKASYIASLWGMPDELREIIIMQTETCDERNFDLFMSCVQLYCIENDIAFNIENKNENKQIISDFIMETACMHYYKSLKAIK
jgi:HD-like signal output (HDOD) protein